MHVGDVLSVSLVDIPRHRLPFNSRNDSYGARVENTCSSCH